MIGKEDFYLSRPSRQKIERQIFNIHNGLQGKSHIKYKERVVFPSPRDISLYSKTIQKPSWWKMLVSKTSTRLLPLRKMLSISSPKAKLKNSTKQPAGMSTPPKRGYYLARKEALKALNLHQQNCSLALGVESKNSNSISPSGWQSTPAGMIGQAWLRESRIQEES